MNTHWTIDLMWWITAVELPALGGLFWMVLRNHRDGDESHRFYDNALAQLREGLAAYKLEVAKSYASIGTLKDVERRLTEHLLRIETKLDGGRNA